MTRQKPHKIEDFKAFYSLLLLKRKKNNEFLIIDSKRVNLLVKVTKI